MASFDLQLNLPDDIAREAEAHGLSLLRAELRRRHIDRLFEVADRLAALPDPPSPDEIEAEIEHVRREKHQRNWSN